ncbi:sugar transferase [Microbacterium sp. JZ31]|uniref:sugar transferase n=1 Tax=Microbacterium sp. JZ31 TaxID=1906274 RepID=UPI0019344E67|nr:sugar transferase [Microbacterium sp. JZ31]
MTTIDAPRPLLGRPAAPVAPLVAAPEPSDAGSGILPGLAAPATAPSLARRRHREAVHRRLVLAGDTAVLATTWGVVASIEASVDALLPLGIAAIGWWLCLAASRSRDPLLPLSRELIRVAMASGAALGALAVVTVMLSALPSAIVDVAWLAPLLAVAPATLVGLGAVRSLWRRRLSAQLRVGEHLTRAIVIGAADEVSSLTEALSRSEQIRVCGSVMWDDAALMGREDGSAALRRTVDAATSLRADTVIVARVPAGPHLLRRLAWALEGTVDEIVVWPGIAEVSAPRLRMHWGGDVPLLRVAQPVYDARRAAKRVVDVVVATIALIPISILTVPIALAIRLDSAGPVFFRQDRVGEGGRLFPMLKFRSMTASAERDRAALITANEAAGPMFKIHHDPRVTRVGRILRKYSLDELPQFWNVLAGDMSVIGPRPALPSEVAVYAEDERRRLYIKPGISGPWQVGGRSDLGWERGVSLDLHYVENRSIARDLQLMLQTVGAVLRPRGAY